MTKIQPCPNCEAKGYRGKKGGLYEKYVCCMSRKCNFHCWVVIEIWNKLSLAVQAAKKYEAEYAKEIERDGR